MQNKDLKLALNTYQYIEPYISQGDKVLDLGSGNGYVAELLNREKNADITCLDVSDISKNNFKPIIFDGNKIPFEDASFKVVLCSFILHHIPHQVNFLHEIMRVSSEKAIILEDVKQNPIDLFFTTMHKLSSRVRYKSVGMKFHSRKGWKSIFSENGFHLTDEQAISRKREYIYPVSRSVFVLSKTP